MKNYKACLSHNSDDWKTPSILYDALMNEGFIDVCPFQSDLDLYGKIYSHERIYINPPFSELSKWVDYALKLSEDNIVWLLMPVRTDTKYFSRLFDSCLIKEIVFFKGRLKFSDKKGAPFPTMLIKLSPFGLYVPLIRNYTLEEFVLRF